eukprot:3938489-Lingulodinium_polyedra.AAC.1
MSSCMKIPLCDAGSTEASGAVALQVLQHYPELFDDLRSTAISVCYVSTATQEHSKLATGHGSGQSELVCCARPRSA